MHARRRLPGLDRLGRQAWWLVGIGLVVIGAVWLLTHLWVLVLAVSVAILFARALSWPNARLRGLGVPRALAALGSMLGLALLLVGIGFLLIPRFVDRLGELGDTLTEAVDDVETWLVEDAPVDISRADLENLRDEAGQRFEDALSSPGGGGLVSGAMVVLEVFTGLLLAVITCFFMLKDGDRFRDWVLSHVREDRRPLSRRLSDKAWETLGGYLRGAAGLGLVEGVVLGITMWVTGSSLAIPVGVITFFAAFVPFAGALAAGVIAVLVALATSGLAAAVTVAIVAFVVQQLDNDLLAPVIYGRALSMHPVLILFGLVAGSALFGIGGALLSVPVVAVAWNVSVAYRNEQRDALPAGDADRDDEMAEVS